MIDKSGGVGGSGRSDGSGTSDSDRARVGLCADCTSLRRVTSSRDYAFYLCGRAASDPRFAKYPVLPVLTCRGFDPVDSLRSHPTNGY